MRGWVQLTVAAVVLLGGAGAALYFSAMAWLYVLDGRGFP